MGKEMKVNGQGRSKLGQQQKFAAVGEACVVVF